MYGSVHINVVYASEFYGEKLLLFYIYIYKHFLFYFIAFISRKNLKRDPFSRVTAQYRCTYTHTHTHPRRMCRRLCVRVHRVFDTSVESIFTSGFGLGHHKGPEKGWEEGACTTWVFREEKSSNEEEIS